MIKGHAKIELRDEDTGEVSVVEHDNMITDAVADLMKPIGGNFSAFKCVEDTNKNFAQNLFGTLALFESAQDTEAGNYLLPSTNKLIGWADQRSYSGDANNVGTYNSGESGLQEDGSYRHVWDFATNKANGTISSVSLMPLLAGYCGLGTTVYDTELNTVSWTKSGSTVTSSSPDINKQISSPNGSNKGCIYSKNGVSYFVDKDNLQCSTNARSIAKTGNLILHKGYAPSGMANLAGKSEVSVVDAEDIEVMLPEAFVSQFRNYTSGGINCSVLGGVITLWPDGTARSGKSLFNAANSTMVVAFVDIENGMAVTSKTVTNTTGQTLASGYSSYWTSPGYGGDKMLVTPEYLLAISNNGKYYVMKTSDSTDVKEVTFADESELIETSFGYGVMPWFTFGDFAFVCPYSSSGTGVPKIINMKTGKAWYLNANMDRNIQCPLAETDNPLCYLQCNGSVISTTDKNYAMVNPYVLTTKNNLASPVLKTPSQSMKITYTLSE